MAGEFIDAPGPQFIDAPGPQFVDAPGPTQQQAAPAWAANNKPFRLSNGAQTELRQDGYVWLDASKGDPTKNGWYKWSANGWEQGPPEPQAPKKGIARTIAENLLFNPLVQGLTEMPAKGLQLATRIPGVPQGAQRWADGIVRDREQAFSDLPMNQTPLAQVNRAIAGAVPAMMLPVARAATLAGRVGMGAAEGAGSAMLQPTVLQPGQEGQFAAETLKQGALGGVLGGGIPTLGGAVKGTKRLLVGEVDPAAAASAQLLGDRFGVRMSAGDITANPGTSKVEVAMENVPGLGMGKFRLAQDMEAKAAAGRVGDELMQQMAGQNFDSLASVESAARGVGKRAKVAQSLLSAIETSGDDWKLVAQTSGNIKLFGNKLRADKLYRRVEDLSAQHGEVPMMNTVRAIEEAKRELAASALPDEQTLRIVSTLERNLNQESAAEAQGVVAQAVGSGVTSVAPLPAQSAVDTSYSGLRNLRGSLGDKISDYYTGKNSVVGKEGVGLLERVKGAVEQDMEEFAKTNGPELKKAWRDADSYYRNNVAPYKERGLAMALKADSPEKLAGYFMSKGDPSTKARILSALDPKGQAAIRAGILQEALEGATNPSKGVQAPTFSPARFASFLEKHSDSVNVAFKGEEKWALNGLNRLMRHVERAGQFAENPPTGNRLAQMAVGGGLVSVGTQSAPLAAGAWLTAKGLQKLYTTPAGKRFLLQAGDLQPGTPAMQRLIDRLPAMLGQASGKPSEPSIAAEQQPQE